MNSQRSLYGYIVFVLLIGLPVVLWLAPIGLSEVSSNSGTLVKMAGKASAFIGLAAYSLMPILSMRHKILEKAFGGLDVLYHLHTKVGKISFGFILAHPLLLATGGMLSGAGLLGVWSWFSPVVLTGLFGLTAITVLTAFAIYAHIKHQKWVVIHRLFGWLLPLLFAHALIARGQITTNRPLFIYMISLGVLGFAAFMYRSVFGHFLIKNYRYAVAEVNNLTPLVTELVLKPLGIPINYTPGQFAYVSLQSDGIDNEAHPYSFTTANNGPYVRFTIKQLGDDTAHMKDVRPGARAYLEGPYGNFSLHNARRQQVWIAGGVGITPFLSMARSLSGRSGYTIKLFYASEELQDAVFLHELIMIRKTIPASFELIIVNRKVSGFIGIETLKGSLDDLRAFDYLICGPPMMMQTIKDQLLAAGVQPQQIFTEEFSIL